MLRLESNSPQPTSLSTWTRGLRASCPAPCRSSAPSGRLWTGGMLRADRHWSSCLLRSSLTLLSPGLSACLLPRAVHDLKMDRLLQEDEGEVERLEGLYDNLIQVGRRAPRELAGWLDGWLGQTTASSSSHLCLSPASGAGCRSRHPKPACRSPYCSVHRPATR